THPSRSVHSPPSLHDALPIYYSEDIARIVDEEVRRLIDAAHDEAWEILHQYRDVLDRLVLELLERETLNEQELAEIFAPVTKREPRPVWLSSDTRTVSDKPPVRTPAEIAAGTSNGMLPQDEAAAAGVCPGIGQAPPAAPGGCPVYVVGRCRDWTA